MKFVTSKYVPILFIGFLCEWARASQECTLTCQYFKVMHENPVLLYQCYRNATSYEPEGSSNVAAFLDGTQSEETVLDTIQFFASDSNGGSVTRLQVSLVYDPETDTISVTLPEGNEVIISLLEVFEQNSFSTSEVSNGEYASKIYDIDQKCPTAKKYFESECDDCGLAPSRDF